MVSGGNGHNVPVAQVAEDGLGKGGSFLGVSTGAQLVYEHQGMGRYPVQDAAQVLDVGTEGGQGLFNALLVADVGVDAVQQREFGHFGGDVQAGMGHQGQETHGLEGHGLAAGVGAGDDQYPVVATHFQVDGDNPLGEEGMAGGGDAEAWDALTPGLGGALTPGPSP